MSNESRTRHLGGASGRLRTEGSTEERRGMDATLPPAQESLPGVTVSRKMRGNHRRSTLSVGRRIRGAERFTSR